MLEDDDGQPSVLMAYPGADPDPDKQDIFVYVRPETNSVQIESRLLRVVRRCPAYRKGLELIYMANLPGEYIIRHRVVERHYSHTLFFAVHGAASFSEQMKHEFELNSGEAFRKERIIGGFEALSRLGMTPEELFAIWVDNDAVITVAGQTLKFIDGYWIIGYDIPALMHKNTRNTDIAVMLFRTTLGYHYFAHLVADMFSDIRSDGLVDNRMPRSRVFHYSRSPFEQMLDGTGYLVVDGQTPAGLSDLSFSQFAMGRGFDLNALSGILSNPMFIWERPDGGYFERDIYSATEHMNCRQALAYSRRALAQRLLHHPQPVKREANR
ncbi:MAG: hypothetical protein ACLFM0_05450 [Spirochaetales bacterium]